MHGRFLATLAFTLCACAAQPAAAQDGAATVDVPAGWDELVDRFDTYVSVNQIVGGSALALSAGEIVVRHDYGLADAEAGTVVTDRTIFHWGSITKTLTAIAIMQLRDRGLLSLNDPVTRWVPELRQIHDPYGAIDSITIEMLLSHSSGLQNPTWPWTEGREWEPFEPTTWNQLVAMMPYQKLLFRPGERYSYSNPGFIYLARVIETLTGDAWQTYIQKNLFSPLGLAHSYFGTTPYWLAPDRSHNYDIVPAEGGGTRRVDNGADFDPGITIPNGGWNAPIDELAAYAAFLTKGGAHGLVMQRRFDSVLDRATLEEMWQPRVKVSDDPAAGHAETMGLSFFLVRDGDHSVIGHTGSQAGFRAFFYFQPQRQTAVILVFNTANSTADERARSAFDDMIRAAYAVADPLE
jgi:CubicO group peptidase (beta-lactamase class C family)